MRVTGTKDVEITLNDNTIKKITKEYLCDLVGIRYGTYGIVFFIKDDNLVRSEEISAGSHSYFEDTVVRPATELDKAVLTILNVLK